MLVQPLRNNVPIPELEAEAATLDALIMLNNLSIAAYQWHVNWTRDELEVAISLDLHPLEASILLTAINARPRSTRDTRRRGLRCAQA